MDSGWLSLFVSERFVVDFQRLLELESATIAELARLAKADDDSLSFMEAFEALGIHPSVGVNAIAILRFLWQTAADEAADPSDIVDALVKTAHDKKTRELTQKHRAVLQEAVSYSAATRTARLHKKAMGSILPVLAELDGTWDVRCIPGSPGEAPVHHIPVLLMRLTTQYGGEETALTFQLDVDGLERLEQTLALLRGGLSSAHECAATLNAGATAAEKVQDE